MSNQRNNKSISLGFQSSLQQRQVGYRLYLVWLPWQNTKICCRVNFYMAGSSLSQLPHHWSFFFRFAVLHVVRRNKLHSVIKWYRKSSITEIYPAFSTNRKDFAWQHGQVINSPSLSSALLLSFQLQVLAYSSDTRTKVLSILSENKNPLTISQSSWEP